MRLELEHLEHRTLLSTVQNFDSTGTNYSLQQIGGPPTASVKTGGPTGNYLNLATTPTNPVAGNNNSISFDTSDPGTYAQATADWDFRVTQTVAGESGVGMSFALLNTVNYGTSGQASSVQPQQGIYNGSLGIGFDTNSDTIYLAINGAIQSAQSVAGQIDLASGQFIHARAEINFGAGTVSLVLTPSLSGSPVTVFDATQVPGLSPYQSRVGFQAENTAATFADFDLDNVNVQWSGLRQTGTISFGSTSYVALENQGVALIDVQRGGGTAGNVTIGYVAADGTAKHGVNYVAVSGVLTFGEGETVKTIAVPIIPDQIVSGNKTVTLYLSNPALNAPLGRPIVSTLTIVETDPVPPTVSPRVRLVSSGGKRVAGFQLTFTQPMDPISTQNLANYQVSVVGKRGARRDIAISQAVLDPSGLSVTLYRADQGRVRLSNLVQILVRGTPITGLQGASGIYLAGNGSRPGTDALLRVHV
ncbi:MAG: Calx-beta domain-containing protein [Isosphaeraceae bacterium]